MNTQYRKSLAGTELDYYDTRAAVEAIQQDGTGQTRRALQQQKEFDGGHLAEWSFKAVLGQHCDHENLDHERRGRGGRP